MVTSPDMVAATNLLTALERRIADIEQARIANLGDSVDILSSFQAFFYTTDAKGVIQIDRDAPFVAISIVVSGNDMLRGFILSIIRKTSRYMTNADTPSITGTDATVMPENVQVPLEMFTPAFRHGDYNISDPLNVDYFCRLRAEQVLPPGDTVQCAFTSSPYPGIIAATAPNVTFIGYKVFPKDQVPR